MGDFNIKMNRTDDDQAEYLRDLMESVDYRNFVDFPTHRSGNTIDLILSAAKSNVVCNVKSGEFFSDHAAVRFEIICTKESQFLETKDVRSFRKMNNVTLRNRLGVFLAKWSSTVKLDTPVESLAKAYCSGLSEVIDELAPKRTITVKQKPPQPWMNEELITEIRLRRKLERKWRQDIKNKQLEKEFKTQRKLVKGMSN